MARDVRACLSIRPDLQNPATSGIRLVVVAVVIFIAGIISIVAIIVAITVIVATAVVRIIPGGVAIFRFIVPVVATPVVVAVIRTVFVRPPSARRRWTTCGCRRAPRAR